MGGNAVVTVVAAVRHRIPAAHPEELGEPSPRGHHVVLYCRAATVAERKALEAHEAQTAEDMKRAVREFRERTLAGGLLATEKFNYPVDGARRLLACDEDVSISEISFDDGTTVCVELRQNEGRLILWTDRTTIERFWRAYVTNHVVSEQDARRFLRRNRGTLDEAFFQWVLAQAALT